MTKTEFKQIVAEGRFRNREYLVVKIETEGNPTPEIIINSRGSLEQKVRYYDNVYNEDMELVTAKANGKIIRIVDALMTSNLSDLDWFFS
jgi:hypothetical protein